MITIDCINNKYEVDPTHFVVMCERVGEDEHFPVLAREYSGRHHRTLDEAVEEQLNTVDDETISRSWVEKRCMPTEEDVRGGEKASLDERALDVIKSEVFDFVNESNGNRLAYVGSDDGIVYNTADEMLTDVMRTILMAYVEE